MKEKLTVTKVMAMNRKARRAIAKENKLGMLPGSSVPYVKPITRKK